MTRMYGGYNYNRIGLEAVLQLRGLQLVLEMLGGESTPNISKLTFKTQIMTLPMKKSLVFTYE